MNVFVARNNAKHCIIMDFDEHLEILNEHKTLLFIIRVKKRYISR